MLDRSALFVAARPKLGRARPVDRSAIAQETLRLPSRPYSKKESYAYCAEYLRRCGDWGFLASPFVPPQLQPGLCAIYAFARATDDFVDELPSLSARQEALEVWEEALRSAIDGAARHPILIALVDTVERHGLPYSYFLEFLNAARCELQQHRYPTFENLCAVASLGCRPLGRALLHLFGCTEAHQLRYVDELTLALRLVTILLSVGEDYQRRDRVYLPQEDLYHFQVRESELGSAKPSPAVRALVRYQRRRAQALLERGRPLCELVDGPLKSELSLTLRCAELALHKIEAAGDNVLGPVRLLNYWDFAANVALGKAMQWSARLLGRQVA